LVFCYLQQHSFDSGAQQLAVKQVINS